MPTSSFLSTTNAADFDDSDSLLEQGEIFEIKLLTLNINLSTELGPNTEFTIEVEPPRGAA